MQPPRYQPASRRFPSTWHLPSTSRWCAPRRDLDLELDLRTTPIVALSPSEMLERALADGPRFFEAPSFQPHGMLSGEI